MPSLAVCRCLFRLMRRCFLYIPNWIYLSQTVSVGRYIYLSKFISIYMYIPKSLSLPLSFSLSLSLSLSLLIDRLILNFIYLSLYISLYLYIYLSHFISTNPKLSIYLSILVCSYQYCIYILCCLPCSTYRKVVEYINRNPVTMKTLCLNCPNK